MFVIFLLYIFVSGVVTLSPIEIQNNRSRYPGNKEGVRQTNTCRARVGPGKLKSSETKYPNCFNAVHFVKYLLV